jgi:hypothetical protein
MAGDGAGSRPDPLADPLPNPLADPLPDPATAASPAQPAHDPVSLRPAPEAAAPPAERRTESVTCPECGTRADVTVTRRDAVDFCNRCDFPLFWTPSTIQLGDRETAEATLRRLPGTAGRVTVASVPCPHCDEANLLTATTCGRCGRPMVLEEAPAPVVVAPPPPPPAPAPEPRSLWWLWLLLGLSGVLLAALVVWFVVEGV